MLKSIPQILFWEWHEAPADKKILIYEGYEDIMGGID